MGKQYIWNIYTKMQYIYIVSGIYRVKKEKRRKKRQQYIFRYKKAVYMQYIYKNAVYIYCEWYIFCKEKKNKKKIAIYMIYI
jgi:hypothetical protein